MEWKTRCPSAVASFLSAIFLRFVLRSTRDSEGEDVLPDSSTGFASMNLSFRIPGTWDKRRKRRKKKVPETREKLGRTIDQSTPLVKWRRVSNSVP
jgi:hypothetical protein